MKCVRLHYSETPFLSVNVGLFSPENALAPFSEGVSDGAPTFFFDLSEISRDRSDVSFHEEYEWESGIPGVSTRTENSAARRPPPRRVCFTTMHSNNPTAHSICTRMIQPHIDVHKNHPTANPSPTAQRSASAHLPATATTVRRHHSTSGAAPKLLPARRLHDYELRRLHALRT